MRYSINEEVRRLSSLIQNLLNVSKIEMGGMSLQTGLVKTDWLIEDCAQAFEKNAQEKDIHFTKNLPDKFPNIIGDKELLKTALINILGNAIKYTPQNGAIVFSMADKDDHVTFSVSDTGYGISEAELPRIFEKFYRSEDPDISEQTGSGLGLAMTSEIIQLHGGNITVESEVKKGSEFTITLPKEKYYLEQTG